MLRLRPSEITLTLADVEETRRRMARRPVAVPTPPVSARTAQGGARPGTGPHLRRGAARSRDDALTSLGNIPILRPHRAIHSSTDFDSDDDLGRRRDSAKADSDHSDDNAPVSSFSDTQIPQTPAHPSYQRLDTTSQTVQLPLRLALRGGVNYDNDDLPMPIQPSSPEEERLLSPSENTAQSASSAQTPMRDDRLRDSTDGVADSPQTPRPRAPAHTPRQLASSHEAPQSDTAQRHPTVESPPTYFLQGYFRTPDEYSFRQYRYTPHTEPRRSDTQQHRSLRGSASQSDLPTFPHFSSSWESPRAPPEIPSGASSHGSSAHHQGSQNPYRVVDSDSRQRVSEASSSSSQPYSYYELPDSRHSSSNQSHRRTPLSDAQYDGVAPHRQPSQGVYLPFRPSRIDDPYDTHMQQLLAMPSYPSSHGTGRGQQGVSPLPASPYSRAQATQTTAQPVEGLINSNGLAHAGSAIDALQRNLPSPLELIQRSAHAHSSRLGRQSETRSRASERSPYTRPSEQFTRPPRTTPSRDHTSSHHGADPRRRHPSESDRLARRGGPMLGPPAAHYTYNDEIRTRSAQSNVRARVQRSSENNPTSSPSTTSSRIPRSDRTFDLGGGLPPLGFFSPPRPPDIPRIHSSEWTPDQGDGLPPLEDFESPHPSVVPRVIRGERTLDQGDGLPPLGIFSSSLPSDTYNRPSDVSNRQRRHLWRPSGPAPRGMNLDAPPSYNHDGRDSNPLSPHQSRITSHGRPAAPASTRTTRAPIPAPPSIEDIPPRRSSIRTPSAPSPRRAPGFHLSSAFERSRQRVRDRGSVPGQRPRVPPRQEDQENSGEVEEERMREEMEGAGMRHGGEGGETMDETPPRVGRMERQFREQ